MALAKSTTAQTPARRAALAGSRDQQAASDAQSEKAAVQLGYTLISAPITGIVDVRAALQGEVVNPGQGIVTLIDPDNLWVRADVGETYINNIRLGNTLHGPASFRRGTAGDGFLSGRGCRFRHATGCQPYQTRH